MLGERTQVEIAESNERRKMTDEVVGYIHNVSPMKHSEKTKYFDLQVQTENAIVRGVCFAQQKRDQFETFSKQKPPVKLTKCTLTDQGQRRTILMNSRTQLEQTNVEFAFWKSLQSRMFPRCLQ